MSPRQLPSKRFSGRSTWRDYQQFLNKERQARPGRVSGVWVGALVFTLVLAACFFCFPYANQYLIQPVFSLFKSRGPNKAVPAPKPAARAWARDRVRDLLSGQNLLNRADPDLEVTKNSRRYKVKTTLDPRLQTLLAQGLDKANSRYIGIVLMEPDTGRLKAVVGYDRDDPANNPCFSTLFPAASLFKIVTAAAAIQEKGFAPQTPLSYNGRKYTLYKSQLENKNNKYTRNITFAKAFALSINPVFGKIGVHHLGQESLGDYAKAFGFNQPIDFDENLALSRFSVSQKPFHIAEIACGFNRQTTLTPLHAALMVADLVNKGVQARPFVVDAVFSGSGNPVYQQEKNHARRVVAPKTADLLMDLMGRTISAGTAKKAFRGASKDKVLSRLRIGGKTGSILDKGRTVRIDWFSGFAVYPKDNTALALAVVVGHEKYIGKRAAAYGREAIKAYFQNHFEAMAARKAPSATAKKQ